jgi:hypothetical protein
MWSEGARADGARGLQRHGHGADNRVTSPATFTPSQDDPGAADTGRVSGERSEYSILRIGARLRINRFVFADNLNTHEFHTEGRTLWRARCSPN